jgi:hypothetical protein
MIDYITDFSQDPFKDQFVVGIHGKPGSGKTTAILDLARCGQFVFLVSIDRGTSRVRLDPRPYKGRLAVAYPQSNEEIKDVARITVEEKVPGLIKKGVPGERIWICVDTATHLQQKLLHEVREFDIMHPEARTRLRRDSKNEFSRRILDFTTDLDWNVNAGMMNALSEILLRNPVNIVFTFLEKNGNDSKQRYRAIPALQGSSQVKFVGDLDVLLHLYVGPGGERVFHTRTSLAWDAKDRFGVLDENEPFVRVEDGAKVPALLAIRRKIFPAPNAA